MADISDMLSTVVTSLPDAVKQVYQYKSQKDILDINKQRAAQGLPPLDVSSIAPQINIGIDPQLKAILIFLGIAAAGGLVYMMVKKRRH